MRRTILLGYAVHVEPIPLDNGGGRVIQIAAKDGSELLEIALPDEDWDEIVDGAPRPRRQARGAAAMTLATLLLPYIDADSLDDQYRTACDVSMFAPIVPRLVDCSSDDYAYARHVSDAWQEGRELLIVEHDIDVSSYLLGQLTRCRYEWCACHYRYPGRARDVVGLGVVRFSGRLVAGTPDVGVDMRRLRWGQLDDYLARVLFARRHMRHVHGRVNHRKEVAASCSA